MFHLRISLIAASLLRGVSPSVSKLSMIVPFPDPNLDIPDHEVNGYRECEWE